MMGLGSRDGSRMFQNCCSRMFQNCCFKRSCLTTWPPAWTSLVQQHHRLLQAWRTFNGGHGSRTAWPKALWQRQTNYVYIYIYMYKHNHGIIQMIYIISIICIYIYIYNMYTYICIKWIITAQNSEPWVFSAKTVIFTSQVASSVACGAQCQHVSTISTLWTIPKIIKWPCAYVGFHIFKNQSPNIQTSRVPYFTHLNSSAIKRGSFPES